MRIFGLIASVLLSASAMFAESASARLENATAVFKEIMATPDKGIPQDLLEKAQCVAIVPGMKKAAFVLGGQYGKGFVICRKQGGTGWGAPTAVRLEGGSFGFQLGASATDVVMLVMNERGMNKLLESKFTMGGDASVAAGPVGRTAEAQTDAYMTAEILAWSRSKGLFAGVSLKGSTLRNDLDDNKELYGRPMTGREVLTSNVMAPPAARSLIAELDRYSMHKEGTSADRMKEKH